MKLGKFNVNYLNGGTTKMDGGAIFGVVPKPLWSKKYDVNDKNQVPNLTYPILIETGDKNILVDAGIGNGKLSEKQLRNYAVDYESKIDEELKRYGLSVDDIDIVLMTHMHFDHATGLTDVEGNAIFKNALHYIQQDEWHEFISPNIRSQATYWKKNRGTYEENVLLFDKEIAVYPGIKMMHTGGHSYGQSIVMIESDEEKAVHMSDIFPTHAHNNPLWVCAYDDYPMQSIREKERLIPYFIKNDYWFLYYHDNKYFAVKYENDGKTIKEKIER
ncbi:MBL fold metallo-hydrolase [Staphylococcus sp. NRL 16/872]|uniref:YtnP family quorum-quenching lactonase n=1 Tax=Staphylococcus sp. NRL 16/872 TaxID=2930131 RepID=UPI001FB1F777|nr:MULTISPECIES: MBL fold metallo-hydrolase [unclassified Staphylococcus]MCJ1661885.1 MBL fold metallo-hydrolase [Staphylococcus sp. NRL 18/288]MCJ1667918.1 MBL fold metallo-hydrolase [Staphylococcus sp. NRL 19/737]WEN70407.1 MBL fold metallo-hydrolase [Staphylococcus sp. NRL 16/872]